MTVPKSMSSKFKVYTDDSYKDDIPMSARRSLPLVITKPNMKLSIDRAAVNLLSQAKFDELVNQMDELIRLSKDFMGLDKNLVIPFEINSDTKRYVASSKGVISGGAFKEIVESEISLGRMDSILASMNYAVIGYASHKIIGNNNFWNNYINNFDMLMGLYCAETMNLSIQEWSDMYDREIYTGKDCEKIFLWKYNRVMSLPIEELYYDDIVFSSPYTMFRIKKEIGWEPFKLASNTIFEQSKVSESSHNMNYNSFLDALATSSRRDIYSMFTPKEIEKYEALLGVKLAGHYTESGEGTIKFKLDNFKHHEIEVEENKKVDYYYVEDEIDGIYATIEGNFKPKEVSYTIKYKNLLVSEGNLPLTKNIEIKPAPLFIGVNTIYIKAIDTNNKIIECTLELDNLSASNASKVEVDTDDNDKDGVMNFTEDIRGTDKNKVDTDNDTLTDYQEIVLTLTNPTIFDSFEDKVSDADVDIDYDKISNKKELELGTNPLNKDTDGDGFSDYDEVYVYFTDPLNADENKNGVIDGKEIKDLTINHKDSEDLNLKITLKGEVSKIKDLGVEIVDNSFHINKDTPWLIGNAYNLSNKGNLNFDNLTLDFEIDKKLFNDPNFEPAIGFMHPETNELITLDNYKLNGNVLTVTFNNSTRSIFTAMVIGYILGLHGLSLGVTIFAFNKHYIESHKANLIVPDPDEATKGKDVAILLDFSLSMRPEKDMQLLNTAIQQVITDLGDNVRVSVFDRYMDTLITVPFKMLGTGTNRKAIKQIIDNYYYNNNTASYNGGDFYSSLNTVKNYIVSNSTASSKKHIIVLSNGADVTNSQSLILKTENIIVSQFSLKNTDLFNKRVEAITGGRFIYVADSPIDIALRAKALAYFINDAGSIIDTDLDGLEDYIEQSINDGVLEEVLGVKMKGKLSFSNPASKDTDKDGLLDGEEIELVYSDDKKTIIGYRLKTDPTNADTDGDGLNDYMEIAKIPTSIGELKTNPIDADTDNDGLSDSSEIDMSKVITYKSMEYYRVHSNPLLSDSDVDTISDKEDAKPMFYKATDDIKDKAFDLQGDGFNGVMNNTFVVEDYSVFFPIEDTSNFLPNKFDFNNNKVKIYKQTFRNEIYLIEFNAKGDPINYWLETARTGFEVRGGFGNKVFVKSKETPNDFNNPLEPFSLTPITGVHSWITLLLLNTDKINTESKYLEFGNKDNFIFYVRDESKFMKASDPYVNDIINLELRYKLNNEYDKYLPLNPQEADLQGFVELQIGNKLHDHTKNHKYVHVDGREAIYNRYTGKSLVLLKDDYTKQFGPTFNYVGALEPQHLFDGHGLEGFNFSKSVGHFYFDMITFFWWGAAKD